MFGKCQTTLYPGLRIERKLPINSIEGSDSDFFRNVDLDFKPISLFQYTNVNVTPEGIVFKNIEIDKELLIYPKHIKIYNWLYLFSTLVKRKKIKLPANENYLLCFDYWSNSIFHWMCDALPRIEAVKNLAKDCILLLPKHFEYQYIHETLNAFKFKGIYLIDDKTYLNCKNLFVAEQITTSGQIRPENILSLRQTLLTYFKPKFTNKINFKNIYISRNKAKYRKVINETDLLPLLTKYKFEVVFFEDHTVCEQIEMCYNANNIISIHGANLTNVIFLQENKNVLELRKKGDLDNNYFYELTDSVNCNYFYLECEFEDPEPEKNIFSLYADKQQFENSIQKLLNL
jgi:hypothetical protein